MEMSFADMQSWNGCDDLEWNTAQIRDIDDAEFWKSIAEQLEEVEMEVSDSETFASGSSGSVDSESVDSGSSGADSTDAQEHSWVVWTAECWNAFYISQLDVLEKALADRTAELEERTAELEEAKKQISEMEVCQLDMLDYAIMADAESNRLHNLNMDLLREKIQHEEASKRKKLRKAAAANKLGVCSKSKQIRKQRMGSI
jgi:hypothetical protein